MKVILSRKGFDSKNGGKPSPILSDGTLLSIPIPDNGKCRKYSELSYKGQTYKDIIDQLGGNCDRGYCHLDPDIRQGIFRAPPDWKPAFGQCGIPQKTLNNNGVRADDLFLFFGWFRQTTRGADGKLKYMRGAGDGQHIIYGYLQVGQVIIDSKEIAKLHWHPHAHITDADNCLYIARDTLSWDNTRPGHGVLQYGKQVVLTKDGMTKSCWRLPELKAFSDTNKPIISGSYKDAWRTDPQYGEYYRAMDIGQEFVIQETAEVEAWAKSLIV